MWISGMSRKNEVIRVTTVKTTSVNNKVQAAQLRWFGHVMRRGEGSKL